MIALFAETPALPLHKAGPYVAAAYIVFLLVVLVYVWIMARKLTRNSRELRELRAQLGKRERSVDFGPEEGVSHSGENDNENHSHLDSVESGATTGRAEVP